MYPNQHNRRNRKKRGIKTVEVMRGKSGYGFTISGQHPCILSCIVSGSPADRCGLKTGDYLIAVNGMNIAQAQHDDVVRLIGSSSGLLVLQIVENHHESDSSSDEFQTSMHKQTTHSKHKYGKDRTPSSPEKENFASNNRYVDMTRKHTLIKSSGLQDHSTERDQFFHGQHDDFVMRSGGSRDHMNPSLSASVFPHQQKFGSSGSAGHQTKHTIITREARLGKSTERTPTIHPPFNHFPDKDFSSTNTTHKHGFSKHAKENRAYKYGPTSHTSSSSNSTTSMNRHDHPYYPHYKDAPYGMADDETSVESVDADISVVVAYIGSIEMPDDAGTQRQQQQLVRTAVRRLRFEHKVHTLVLMQVFVGGIKLQNSLGNNIAHYHAEHVAFAGMTYEDYRFFGVVTIHEDRKRPERGAAAPANLGYSCHVFMVDPELTVHKTHVQRARTFGIHCSHDLHTNSCVEFPPSPNRLVDCINRMCGNDDSSQDMLPIEHGSNSDVSVSGSNSDSGLGFKEEAAANDQVYVVEMEQVANGARPKQQGNVPLPKSRDKTLSIHPAVANNGAFNEHSHWADADDEVSSAFTPINTNNLQQSCSSFLSGPTDISSASSNAPGSNMPLSEKLNIRAMPDPTGLDTVGEHMRSFEQQNSARNLRHNAHRVLQSQHANHQMYAASNVNGDADSNKSNDSIRSTQSSVSNQGMANVDHGNINEKEGDLCKGSPRASIGPVATRKPIPVSIPVPPSPMDATPSHKPPLPERRPIVPRRHPRTPAPPPWDRASVIDRPKSTPPRASVVATNAMEDDYDSDPGSVYDSHSANTKHHGDRSMDVERWNGRLPVSPSLHSAETKRYSEGFALLKQRQDVKTGVKLKKSGSFKLLEKLRQKSAQISNSHESLVVSDVEFNKSAKLGSASSAITLSDSLHQDDEGVGGGRTEGRSAARATTPLTPRHPIAHMGEVQGSRSSQLLTSTSASTSAPKPPDERPSPTSWAISFDKVLQDKAGVEKFTEFSKQEYSEENIMFWSAVEQYKTITDEAERKSRAQEIFSTHLSPNASEPVNVDSRALTAVKERIEQDESPGVELFDVPQMQIKQLMKTDSYPRFLKSSVYKDCVMADLESHSATNTTAKKPVGSGAGMASGSSGTLHKGGSGRNKQKKSLKKMKSVLSTGSHDDGDDKRRKSLNILPWNRNKSIKNLSKSSMDIDGSGKSNGTAKSGASTMRGPQMTTTHSTTKLIPRSAVAELPPRAPTNTTTATTNVRTSAVDLADLNSMSRGLMYTQEDANGIDKKQKLYRVFFPDGSTTVNHVRLGSTIQATLLDLCVKRNINLASTDVFFSGSDRKAVDLTKDSGCLGNKEVIIEQRVLFRLDLPNAKSLVVKAKPVRTIRDILKPILQRNSLKVDSMTVMKLSTGSTVDLDKPSSILDNEVITAQNSMDLAGSKSKDWGGLGNHRGASSGGGAAVQGGGGGGSNATSKSSLSSSTSTATSHSQLFTDLTQGKPLELQHFDDLGVFDPDKVHYPDDKPKGEDHRNSGIFGFMRRNSVGEREAKKGMKSSQLTRPIPQPSAAHATGSARGRYKDPEEDRFIELLTRVQSHRLDEQRGLTAKDLELPDFLKVTPPVLPNEKTIASTAESVCSSGSSSNRKRERRNSDSSMIDYMSEAHAKQQRSLSQEALDLNSSTFSLHGHHASPYAVIPHSNKSFSQDGILPDHATAESYFSNHVIDTNNVDFNNSHALECSLTDIGMSDKRSSYLNPMQVPPRASKSSTMVSHAVPMPHKLSPRANISQTNAFSRTSSYVPPPPPTQFANTSPTMTHQHSHKLSAGAAPTNLPLQDPNSAAAVQADPNDTTPSPTTHDLILDTHNSPHYVDDSITMAAGSQVKRTLMFHSKHEGQTEHRQDEDMQVSFV